MIERQIERPFALPFDFVVKQRSTTNHRGSISDADPFRPSTKPISGLGDQPRR
jgi:hypothetical protein